MEAEYVGAVDVGKRERAERLIRELITLIGDDPDRQGLRDTPKRVVKAWETLFAGYTEDIGGQIRVFDETYDEVVAIKGIDYFSFCEHHMMPFFGQCHIAYLPAVSQDGVGHVLGASKLARITNHVARRLQIQERMTRQIAETIDQAISPRAVAVIVEGTHMCMVARGVQQPHSVMRTSAILGDWLEDHRGRDEALRLLGL
jgi:GTP cyclohydrolase I